MLKAGGQPNLNTGWLKEFKIIVPNLEKQKEFDDFCPPSHQIKIVRILFLAKPYRDATIIVITINPEKLCALAEVSMITNFDYLKNEPKFSAFANVAISAEKIILMDPEAMYYQQPQGDGVCNQMDVFSR